ncbi:GIY-YIG nuclease family protein [Neorhizobium sp. BETTINA12A]|uniref:GIY-YIG nuclease family protein n=1 Tax=Neorhizobium sp. BETTINA12A TaxID=2908924 RepID=UPI001FF36EBD|nr:GIY-YIG nuclease family protein [Neorhizobium sp. BETTINA12A]MCJ9752073.1 GIY-YIG nuclease family protein [Neorhizobium sp. BETTINA12A]
MSENFGKSVRIHLVEGNPQGILTAEIINWTGHVITAPRSKLASLLARDEIGKAGVYFLLGIDPENDGQNLVYIGQSENISRRLAQHNKDEKKSFWEKTCVVTSKDHNLTSGHIKYLESRLISVAKASGLVSLTNDTAPDPSNLPEADRADMEYFVAQLRLILPLLDFAFLREAATIKQNPSKPSASAAAPSLSPIFELTSKMHSLTAHAQEIDGEFTVQEGSLCRSSWEGTATHTYRSLWETLAHQGKIGPDDTGRWLFKENVAFSSPSAAAAIIYGRAANGRSAWRVQGTTESYDQWQNQTLPQVPDAAE